MVEHQVQSAGPEGDWIDRSSGGREAGSSVRGGRSPPHSASSEPSASSQSPAVAEAPRILLPMLPRPRRCRRRFKPSPGARVPAATRARQLVGSGAPGASAPSLPRGAAGLCPALRTRLAAASQLLLYFAVRPSGGRNSQAPGPRGSDGGFPLPLLRRRSPPPSPPLPFKAAMAPSKREKRSHTHSGT